MYVFEKAQALIDYTITITDNTDRFTEGDIQYDTTNW